MYLLLVLVLNAFALWVTAQIVPGFHVSDDAMLVLLAAIVLGVINTFIKPVLLFLTAPINFLTLGLFTFVINAVVLVLTAGLVHGIMIDNFWPAAILAAIVLSIVSTILSMLLKDLKLSGGGKRK